MQVKGKWDSRGNKQTSGTSVVCLGVYGWMFVIMWMCMCVNMITLITERSLMKEEDAKMQLGAHFHSTNIYKNTHLEKDAEWAACLSAWLYFYLFIYYFIQTLIIHRP